MKPIHAKPSLYAYYFETLKEIAKEYGYNLVLHGSLNRDLDLIAIPWEDKVGDIDILIDNIASAIGGTVMMQDRSIDNSTGVRFKKTHHGRVIYVININRDFKTKYNGIKTVVEDYADPQYYLDISVLPVIFPHEA